MSLLLLNAAHTAFLSPTAPLGSPMIACARTPNPISMGVKMTRKERRAAAAGKGTVKGVVVPTSIVEPSVSPNETTAMNEGTVPAPTLSEVQSKLPPLTGSRREMVQKAALRTKWNPQGLDVAMLPAALQSQFVPDYLTTAPSYLDGSMPGDVGFDPWGLVALASPTAATDKFARTAKERDEKMLAKSPEEQKQALAWMRESEIKHGRLAMLAAAGWPLAELSSGTFLKQVGTNGRCPSLFNGHLLDYLPFLLVAFAPVAYLELQNKDKLVEGDYGFDPLGLSGDQRPYGAVPFDGLLSERSMLSQLPNVKDLEAMKLAELKNGRVAMMAITGFAVQEFVWGTPVVEQTPFFFGR